jgi:hypothetical protein
LSDDFSRVAEKLWRDAVMVVIEENCSLCGVTFPYYALSRCYRCNRLYCRNCLIYDEEGKLTCLKCAKRRLMPKAPRSKYAPLSTFLARKAKYANFVALSFKQIEDIIGDKLPYSAYDYEHWWNNNLNRSQSEAWLTVGWNVETVNLTKREVAFRKEKPTSTEVPKKRQRRKPVSAAFKALALKRRPRKPLSPSKTKLAKTQARLKNIEKQRATPRTYKGKFKPKSAYEKKLYKAAEKPE